MKILLKISPVGAGVGPAQLVGFPHQKTPKDPVEDVPLLVKSKKQAKMESSPTIKE